MALLHTGHLRVRPEVAEAFHRRLLRHAGISVAQEPGCRSFDVHQSRDDPALFLLLEVYADDAALEAHRAAPHYLAFREGVKDWVVERTWYFWNAA